MHQFTSLFPQETCNLFLEKVLVYKENIENTHLFPEKLSLQEIEQRKEKLVKKISLEKNSPIAEKERVKNALGINDYEKYKKAESEMKEVNKNEYSRFWEVNTQINNLLSFIHNKIDDENLSEKKKEILLQNAGAQLEKLWNEIKNIFDVIHSKNSQIWEKYFPKEEGFPVFYDAVRQIYFEQKNAKEHITLKEEYKDYPEKNAPISHYVKRRANMILDQYKDMNFLKNDPFLEVIEFVKNNGEKPLSFAGQIVLKKIRSESVQKKLEKSLSRDVKKVKNLSQNKKETQEDFIKRIHSFQANIIIDPNTYQLAMIDIANRADEIINKKQYKLSPEKQKFLESIIPQGHMVKNNFTDRYKGGATQTLGVDKVNLENFFLYEVAGTWGIITTIANIMVAIKNGNWEQALPYILAGGTATYLSADMVFNHTLDKKREPEKMPQWIFKEKDNRDYEEFFGDKYEIALWENIRWPNTSTSKKALMDTIKGSKKTKKTYIKKNLTKKEEKDVDYFEKTKHIDVSKTLSPSDFSKGNILEDYLPDMIEMNNTLIPKETLLAKLPNTPKRNSVRYRMLKKTIARLGDSDSYIPYLHTLHTYAKEKQNKKNDESFVHENISERLSHLAEEISPGYAIATTPSHYLSNNINT